MTQELITRLEALAAKWRQGIPLDRGYSAEESQYVSGQEVGMERAADDLDEVIKELKGDA